MSSDKALDRSKGCLAGLAVGDAIGTTLEFKPRGTFKPLTDMKGGGHFSLKKGYWTDDTSMALCLGHSLVECQGFNPKDQIEKYCDWMDNGYMSSIGVCFDVGITVSSALRRYQKTGEPYSGSKAKMSSGNGSIMRLAPIPIYFHRDIEQAEFFGGESSRTTHGSEQCVDSCRYLSKILSLLINGSDKQVVFDSGYAPTTQTLERIVLGSVNSLSYDDLTGSGYVIESLESALWCFLNTDCFDSCVLSAANLGNDADTTAAIAGQLAGAYYGHSGIRKEWREALYLHSDIMELANRLYLQGGEI
ncbi:ADP-ribosylglycohydrolase family protein [Vibrio hannami]|uniref:ADP-ribosylglycohydrolase family protein n=1 Tax=Vibrio hannami TaxID=2717094 RepID=UPI00240F6198|nr:ADP-ribosylglycohydrolase family protein [Vibrio hannami]MDG3085011.1 ADP-ribosylglycohydrolase family protein [Vibrio hannami]